MKKKDYYVCSSNVIVSSVSHETEPSDDIIVSTSIKFFGAIDDNVPCSHGKSFISGTIDIDRFSEVSVGDVLNVTIKGKQ